MLLNHKTNEKVTAIAIHGQSHEISEIFPSFYEKCKDIFIAENYTKATTLPPKWRYCKKCCNEIGINYEKQTPRLNRTPEEQLRMEEFAKRDGIRNKNVTNCK